MIIVHAFREVLLLILSFLVDLSQAFRVFFLMHLGSTQWFVLKLLGRMVLLLNLGFSEVLPHALSEVLLLSLGSFSCFRFFFFPRELVTKLF